MQTNAILDLARSNGGLVTSAMVDQAGIGRGILKHLADAGRLVRAGRGVYRLPDAPEDRWYALQVSFGRGVFSHVTALALLGLVGDFAGQAHMTFPVGYNTSGARKRGVAAHVAKDGQHEFECVEMLTPLGHPVRVYSAERSLCTAAKAAGAHPDPLLAQAFERYGRLPSADVDRLERCSQVLGTTRCMRSWLQRLRER